MMNAGELRERAAKANARLEEEAARRREALLPRIQPMLDLMDTLLTAAADEGRLQYNVNVQDHSFWIYPLEGPDFQYVMERLTKNLESRGFFVMQQRHDLVVIWDPERAKQLRETGIASPGFTRREPASSLPEI